MKATPDPDGRVLSAHDESSRRQVAKLIGLGVRARHVVIGAEQVRQRVRKGVVALVVVATDVSHNTLGKLHPLLRARGVEILEWPSASELGELTGRPSTAALAVLDAGLARGIREAAAGSAGLVGASRTARQGGWVE